MRTRLFTRLTNREIEAYLERNDLLFIPVGTVEMHGALPVDCETVLPDAISVLLAERSDGLVLPNLPYFYPGGTTIGRGTVPMSIRAGYDYLTEILKCMEKLGFGRIVFVSYHAPAALTLDAVARDYFDAHRLPVLHLNSLVSIYNFTHRPENAELLKPNDRSDEMILAAYDMFGRLEDIPLTTEPIYDCTGDNPQTTAKFNALYKLGSGGFVYADPMEHLPTIEIPTAEVRKALAHEGRRILEKYADWMNVKELTDLMKERDRFTKEEILPKYPWL